MRPELYSDWMRRRNRWLKRRAPAIVFAGAFVISDTLGLYETSRPGRQRVAHSGHLGGALAGATVIGVLRFVFRVVR